MNWDDMRFFLAVTHAGQIARAAVQLGVDATTVTRRIRRLEQSLGHTLFEQRRDGQHLTEMGERLAAKADALERAMSDVTEQGAHPLEGVVRVSASEGFGTWFVAPRLGAFSANYPRLNVDLVANSGFLSPSRRETDLAIVLARPRKGPLVSRRLTDYALRLYASRTYAERTPISSKAALRAHPLIGYIPDFLYAPELDYLEEIDPQLSPRLRSSSINAQHRMAAAGAGVAVLPCFIGDTDPALVRVLDDVRITRSFWLATHRDVIALPRTRAFVDWLVGAATADRELLLGL
ncbi:LysR family transcriptional regulator [Sphingomonas populi]|uniref:LysR family transcriptional regulator n=1 Tax=Sphingomonas populi TaxID=2484750 RepID=A0A4Q6Y9N0_9SPHN|nr:LysR family transcriptional regulator [Sphingomonas populi]RZF66166.1 LysR family transcriptional regulator [Sphingomonas populi]